MSENNVEAELAATVQNFANVFGDEVLELVDEQIIRIPFPFPPGEGGSDKFVDEKGPKEMAVVIGDNVLPGQVDQKDLPAA